MRWLVISDTHRSLNNAFKVIDDIHDKIDGIIHLGDLVEDVEMLKRRYPNTDIYNVPGNCDYIFTGDVDEKLLVLGGKRIFITHGHKYGVNSGIYRLALRGKELNADCCLYGHTHVPLLEYDENMLIMNPGSISSPRGNSTFNYGVLIVEDDEIRASLVKFE
jgi:hypothetical protein